MPAIRNTRSTPNASAGPSKDPARPRPADSELETDEKYSTGDFTIIARRPGKKATIFRLPSFYMLAASSVIRDTFEIGTAGGKLELEIDAQASAVSLWLDLLTGGDLTAFDFHAMDAHRLLRGVLSLCQQFDCSTATNAIMAQLEISLDSTKVPAVDSLITAAMFGAPRVFEKAVRTNGNRLRTRKEGGLSDLEASLPSAELRNPINWSLRDFCRLPPAYCWALLRSHTQANTKEEHADKLKVLLALIEDQSKSKPVGLDPSGELQEASS